jgi:hypothetical protein
LYYPPQGDKTIKITIDTKWKFWFHTVALLAGGISIEPVLLYWAVLLTVYQLVHFGADASSPLDFPVQVRACYLVIMLVGFAPGYYWIHYVQLIGTTAMVTAGYCALARVLALMPWNRDEPLNKTIIANTIFSRSC